MSILTGYVRCKTCGEFYCTTCPGQTGVEEKTAIMLPGAASPAAPADGIPCPKCGTRNTYVPGAAVGTDAINELCQWPELEASLMPCRHGEQPWKDPAYQAALNRARAMSGQSPPDPNEILEIVTGENAEGEGPFYRVIRRGRRHEPVVFPCGDELNELFENDPDFHDDETFLDVLTEEGEVVFTHEWDSGGPGIGGGVECIYELAGRFYYPCEHCPDMIGPYDSLNEAVESDQLLTVNSATKVIESSYHDDEELVSMADTESLQRYDRSEYFGHEVLFNYISYIWTEPGRFVRNENEEDLDACIEFLKKETS